jgi:phosphatidylinositol phosphate synthase
MMERFRAFWTKVISPVAHLLIRLGVSPDAVTLVGTLGVCAGALVFFPQGMLLTGVLVITAFVFSDLLDGYMARTTGRASKFGAFWDSTLDRVGDGAIFIGLALYFAWEEPSRLYLVLSLVCLLMGSVTSYARSRGEALGFNVKVGIAERADRLVAILVLTAFSAIFDLPVLLYIALWGLAIASTVTVVQRVWVVRKQALAEAALPFPHE